MTYCDKCDEDVPKSDIIKMIDSGDIVANIGRDDIKEKIVGDDDVIYIIKSVPITAIFSAMMNGDFSVVDYYAIGSFVVGSRKQPLVSADYQIRAVLEGLHKAKKALVVSVPVGMIRREGVLFSTGLVTTLRWEQELRDMPSITDTKPLTKPVITEVVKFIDSIEGSFDVPDASDTMNKLDELIHEADKKIYVKKEEEEMADIDAKIASFFDNLKKATKGGRPRVRDKRG